MDHLGLTVILLYINDFPRINNNLQFILYADDTNILQKKA